MALDATVAGEDANSYATLVEADAYFADHFSLAKASAWQALTDPQKERALISACNLLETMKVLDKEVGGSVLTLPAELRDDTLRLEPLMRYDAAQRLQFPRNIDIDSDLNPFIQEAVKEAQFEQAVFMLSLDEAALAAQNQGLVKQAIEAGPVRVYESYSGNANQATLFAPTASALMRQFLRRTRRFDRG